MKTPFLFIPLVLAVVCTGCGTPSRSRVGQGEVGRIREVLEGQVEAWNRGSIDGFMAGYLRSQETRFASGGDVTMGWETVRDRYGKRYATREQMGRLRFDVLEIRPLSRREALVFGRWKLERADDAPTGLFTLLMRRTPEGWRIVHDHTSSATP
jgi:ketosteroid isomerase-like protein